jgi:hydrogenase small subunit
MPFMDEPPGSTVSTALSLTYGGLIRKLRGITARTVDKEPLWRVPGQEIKTGYRPTW